MFLRGFFQIFAAVLLAGVAAAQETNAVDIVAVAESALRDGAFSFAFDEATNALATAEGIRRETAFRVAGTALEAASAPAADRLAWLDSVSNPPQTLSAWFRARALSELGRHSEAAAFLGPLRALLAPDDPLAGHVLRDLAFALAADGRPAEAAAALDAVVEGDSVATLDLARLLLSTGNPVRAAELVAPLVADTNASPAIAAAARLLRLRADRDANGTIATNVSVLVEASALEDPSVPADLRALMFASRAALMVPADPDAPVPPEALELARRARKEAADARSASARLDCAATLLAILARDSAPSNAAEALSLARSLVVSVPRAPTVRKAIGFAAASSLAGGRPESALAFADLHLSSFADSPDEAFVQSTKGRALSALDRHAEAASAHLRAAELVSSSPEGEGLRLESLFAAAVEQRAAGLAEQAVATLDRLRAAEPPRGLRVRIECLAAECLAESDPAAAAAAFQGVAAEFSDLPEASSALARAGQLLDLVSAGDEDAMRRAIDLFRRAAPRRTSETNAAAVEVEIPVAEGAELAVQASSALSVGLLQQRLGEHTNALESIRLAASTPDGGAAVEQAKALLPSAYLAVGDPVKALAAFTVFTNNYPSSAYLPDLLFWRASRAFDGGDWSDAAAQFASFYHRYATSDKAPYALYYAAVALFRAQRHSEAEQVSKTLANDHPASPLLPRAAFIRAEALCQQLSFDKAAPLFESVSENPAAAPELAARAAVRRADCYFALGAETPDRYGESLSAYRAAHAEAVATTNGLAFECAYKIGRSLDKMGRRHEALEKWSELVFLPFEASPTAADALWYSRAVLDAAALQMARGARNDAAAILGKLAGTNLPGAEEAERRRKAIKP